MKRFLLKILYFTIPVLLLLTAVEVYLESLPNYAHDKHEWMLQHSTEVKTLVLGHSQNMYGLRPDLLGEGAFNLAMDCQTFRYNRYLLHHYPMPKLQTVIMNYDYLTPQMDMEHMPDIDMWIARYRIYMDCDIHSRLSPYGFEMMQPQVAREKLINSYPPKEKDWDTLGWGKLGNRPPNWDNGQKRAEGNTFLNEELLELNEGFMRDIFDFCRQHKVRVILLNTPVNETFRKHEDPRQVSMNQQLLQRLQQDYPEIEYLDMEADPHFVDTDYYDSNHLNQYGAEKLSKMVRDYLEHGKRKKDAV